MKYLIFADKASAEAVSKSVATAMGAGDQVSDITKLWYGLRKHPANASHALCIHDAGSGLTPAQKAAQVDTLDATWVFPLPIP